MSESSNLVITIATALLGGGVSSAITTSYLEAKRQEKALLRNKLEELHTEFDKVARLMVLTHSLFKRYADGRLSLEEFSKNATAFADELPKPTMERIDSLSAIYFPEVTLAYRSYLTVRERFSAISNNVDEVLDNSPEFKGKISESYKYLMEMDDLTRRAILRCADKINTPYWRRFRLLKWMWT
jgi:hypothetical protein